MSAAATNYEPGLLLSLDYNDPELANYGQMYDDDQFQCEWTNTWTTSYPTETYFCETSTSDCMQDPAAAFFMMSSLIPHQQHYQQQQQHQPAMLGQQQQIDHHHHSNNQFNQYSQQSQSQFHNNYYSQFNNQQQPQQFHHACSCSSQSMFSPTPSQSTTTTTTTSPSANNNNQTASKGFVWIDYNAEKQNIQQKALVVVDNVYKRKNRPYDDMMITLSTSKSNSRFNKQQ